MGCACRGSAGKNGFVHTADDGTRTEVRTEIEAKALVIRKGGTYTAKS